MKKNMLKNGGVLSVFALVTTAVLAITYHLTLPVIEQQQKKQLLSTLNAIVDSDTYNNPIQDDCIVVTDETLLGNGLPKRVYRGRMEDTPTALAIETTAPDGYNGNIEILVGINHQRHITGVRVLEHKETPGLGDKIDLRISDWILVFNGKSQGNPQKWAVRKDGGEFDQFTGATITPRAIVNAVSDSLVYVNSHWQELFLAPTQCTR